MGMGAGALEVLAPARPTQPVACREILIVDPFDPAFLVAKRDLASGIIRREGHRHRIDLGGTILPGAGATAATSRCPPQTELSWRPQ